MNNTLEMQAPSNITYGRGYAYCRQYHIVWATKYRKAVLCGSIETDLKDLLLKYAAEQDIKICAMEAMPDHVHLLVETKPQCKPSDAVKILGYLTFGCGKYLVTSEDGFQAGKNAVERISVAITYYNGTVQTMSRVNWIPIRSMGVDYNNIIVMNSSHGTTNASWHDGDKRFADVLGCLSLAYAGYSDITDIGLSYKFDIDTPDGTAPAFKVFAMNVPLQNQTSANVSVTLINDQGKQTSTYITKVTATTGAFYGAYLSAAKIAKDNHLNGTYYLKTVDYAIPLISGSSVTSYLYAYGGAINAHGGGVYIGQISKNGVSSLTITDPDGNVIQNKRQSSVMSNNSYTDASLIYDYDFNGRSMSAAAGESFIWKLKLEECTYPYGSTSHVNKPALYLRLPYGIAVQSADYSMSKDSASIADAIISVVKQTADGGNLYRIWKIVPDKNLNYGGWVTEDDKLVFDPSRYITIHLSSDKDMDAITFPLRENISLAIDGQHTSLEGAYNRYGHTDKYDVDDNDNIKEQFGGISQELSFSIKTSA